MQLFVIQLLSGLASAASLFLVASGLSLIFGVTRIVNFAHGAFYMLGAYIAFTLTDRFSGPLGFWGGMVAAAVAVGLLGAAFEMLLLRRIYRAPELFQLLATFGATLVVEDLVLLIWGPDDLLAPRAPGLAGAVMVVGKRFPSYDLFLIVLGPVVLGLLWLILHRTRWGVLVRAATQDRDMVAALGVNQKWLFTGVFALGALLAGLGGALEAPRDAVNHAMDINIIVEIFVVVVIGGLGSIEGAFVASILVSLRQRFRHPGPAENLARPRLPPDGGRAGDPPVGPVRQEGGRRARLRGRDRHAVEAARPERAACRRSRWSRSRRSCPPCSAPMDWRSRPKSRSSSCSPRACICSLRSAASPRSAMRPFSDLAATARRWR